MEMKYQDVVLRDFKESDIDDEIRWMNVDTAWMKADTPWEEFEPVDADKLRQNWMDNIQNMPPDAVRWRLEIEVDGKHIGFVSAYFVDENYEWISFMDIKEDTKVYCALGIEICEPDYWCRGIGAKALAAFMKYHADRGETTFVLETWSGNHRMVKCAEKLGFSVCKRDSGVRVVEDKAYDAIVMKKVINQDAQELYVLAMKHIYGDGIPEDNELAVKLLTQAHDMGHVEATYNLGICYHYGYGTTVDLAKAYELYMKAANAGYGKGMELVGRFYNRGIYVEQDRKQAEYWLQKAMESSDPDAVVEARKELAQNG